MGKLSPFFKPLTTVCLAVFTDYCLCSGCLVVAWSADMSESTLIRSSVVRTNHILESYVCAWVLRVPLCIAYSVCVRLLQSSQPLWRPNVLEYFPWMGLNGLFVFENTCLNPAWSWLDVFSQLSLRLQALIPHLLHRSEALLFTSVLFHNT